MLSGQKSVRSVETLTERFGTHPFVYGVRTDNLETVLSHYLAMSVAFPYLQAGAIGRIFEDVLKFGRDVDVEMEATAVVGAFLVWDEFGGHAKLMSGGMPALPGILQTQAFHANLLRKDLRAILGREVKPDFREPTRGYLQSLYNGLSDRDPSRRSAHMAAFERHAGQMIQALWGSVQRESQLPKERLLYFHTHVGGDDPAEPYHVEMTGKMLSKTVCMVEWGQFLDWFEDAYRLNWGWCEQIVKL